MKTRVPILTLWRSTIFFVIGALALIFALQYMCVPTLAQEQSTTAPQPASPPAATPAVKPEVKPEGEKQEAAPAKAEKAKAEAE